MWSVRDGWCERESRRFVKKFVREREGERGWRWKRGGTDSLEARSKIDLERERVSSCIE